MNIPSVYTSVGHLACWIDYVLKCTLGDGYDLRQVYHVDIDIQGLTTCKCYFSNILVQFVRLCMFTQHMHRGKPCREFM